MCNKNEAITIRDEVYNACKNIFNDKISDCYLYGSYARGDYKKESDIGIMIVVDMSYIELNKYRRSVSDTGSMLSLNHDVTVSIKLQPKKELEMYKEVLPYYINVLREGIRYGN